MISDFLGFATDEMDQYLRELPEVYSATEDWVRDVMRRMENLGHFLSHFDGAVCEDCGGMIPTENAKVEKPTSRKARRKAAK
jgi:hypothetical protein